MESGIEVFTTIIKVVKYDTLILSSWKNWIEPLMSELYLISLECF